MATLDLILLSLCAFHFLMGISRISSKDSFFIYISTYTNQIISFIRLNFGGDLQDLWAALIKTDFFLKVLKFLWQNKIQWHSNSSIDKDLPCGHPMEVWSIFMYEGSHKAALLGLSGSASSLMQPQQLIQCWPAVDFSQGLSNILRRQL